MRRVLTATLIILGLLVGGLFAVRFALVSFFYPKPSSMPPVVSETTEELLSRLQSVLERRAPEVLRSLQPGFSKDQISALEAQGGFTLSSDLRTLYQWRNGSKISDSMLFIPGHRFLPLEEIVAERTALRSQGQSASFAQRVFYAVFAGHR